MWDGVGNAPWKAKVLLRRAAGKAGGIVGSRSLRRKCWKIGGKGLVIRNARVSSRGLVGKGDSARAASISVSNASERSGTHGEKGAFPAPCQYDSGSQRQWASQGANVLEE